MNNVGVAGDRDVFVTMIDLCVGGHGNVMM